MGTCSHAYRDRLAQVRDVPLASADATAVLGDTTSGKTRTLFLLARVPVALAGVEEAPGLGDEDFILGVSSRPLEGLEEGSSQDISR